MRLALDRSVACGLLVAAQDNAGLQLLSAQASEDSFETQSQEQAQQIRELQQLRCLQQLQLRSAYDA